MAATGQPRGCCGVLNRRTYFDEIHDSRMQQVLLRLGSPLPGNEVFLFAGYWPGILITHPGSGSGRRTIESFHVW